MLSAADVIPAGQMGGIGVICRVSQMGKWEVGQPRWPRGLAPPSAQGVILETRDQSHVGLPAWSLLLPLPVSLPLSLSMSIINNK